MRKALFAVTLLLVTDVAVQAYPSEYGGNTRYRWRDAQGQLHYSDSLANDALKYGYDVVNDRGTVVRHVSRPLTPEEAAQARQQTELATQRQRAADEAARADAQMLAAYPDEASFQAAQQMALDTIDQQIGTTRGNLATQEKALADLLARAGDLEREQHAVPASLNEQIGQQRAVVASQRALLDRLQSQRTDAVQKNTARLQHYRQVKTAVSQPQP
jgi:DNA repair exonuclease SbcCD ATPase subunit